MSEYTSYIGIAAGVCTAISSLPQLFKIIKKKRADDISYFMLGILIVGVSLWTWYGVEKNDYPIIITNAFSVLVNLIIIIFTFIYKKRKK